MKDKIRSQKGFAVSDGLIAILIIALFASLIANISYNMYLANSSVKRMSKATGYIVDVFEYIDKIYYDEVTIEKLTDYFNNKYYIDNNNPEVKLVASEAEETNTPFKVELALENYNQIPGNEDKIDLVKEITIKVTYKLGNKSQTIQMKRIKQRENLEIPNKPDLGAIELQVGEFIYPIKKVNEEWVVCDNRDSSWYNYENGNWAIVLKTNRELEVDEKIDVYNLEAGEKIYGWIPRYAYDTTNNELKFLFRNTNKTKNETEEKLEDINQEKYKIPEDFRTKEKELDGIWVYDYETEAYKNLEKAYGFKDRI